MSNSIPYGATGALIERQIETTAGVKPEPGTGEKIINAYKTNFPGADRYLTMREEGVSDPGYFRSVSGRIRHFMYTNILDLEGVSENQRKSILSPLLREARNYPMQEIVAATMARANAMLLDDFIKRGMKARVMILLYDAMTVLCPLEERFVVKELLWDAMSRKNCWPLDGRTLRFGIDTDVNIRWATDPDEEEAKLLAEWPEEKCMKYVNTL